MATKAIATWALTLQYSSIPSDVHKIATQSIANWAGCAIGGYAQPAAVAAFDTVSPFIPELASSTILGTDYLADANTAALVNGVASHADDYDDTLRDNSIHPSGSVLSALLAVAEWKGGISGEDFITAFVAGVEAECKLGISVWPEHYDVGWHITSTVGSVGASVAVGKLLGLNTTQLQHAISIASVQVTGMHESFGTDTKPFHVGRAAQNGLIAALLASNGFGGSPEGLEAERGWVNVVSTRNNLSAEVDTLGERWEIGFNTFKPYPCDRIIHAAIDGWIQLREQALRNNRDILTITNLTARVHPRAIFLTDDPEPETGLAGKFSYYHAGAIALIYGEATPQQFTDEAVNNSTVVNIRKKVKAVGDEDVSEHEAYVTASFEDGTKLELHIEHCVGSYENPLSTEQLKEKFVGQVSLAIGESRAMKAWDAYWNIDKVDDISNLVKAYGE